VISEQHSLLLKIQAIKNAFELVGVVVADDEFAFSGSLVPNFDRGAQGFSNFIL
jgi:hypothetical protein